MQILVPVDGSRPSAAALEFVASRASLTGVDPDVRLLNVQFPIPLRAARAAGKELVTTYHRAEADAVIKPALARLARAGIQARARYVVGSPGATVGAMAARSRADLVVMGSHGHTAFKGLLFGSVTQAVLAACTKPLLVVREGCVPPSDSLRVAIAVDGSKFGLAAVRFVLAHRALFGSAPQFRLLHAAQSATPKAAFEQAFAPALRLFVAAGVAVEPVRVIGKNAGDAIAADVARRGDDLLVMGSHGHGALSTLLLGSVATRVAARCSAPLLLIRHNRAHARGRPCMTRCSDPVPHHGSSCAAASAQSAGEDPRACGRLGTRAGCRALRAALAARGSERDLPARHGAGSDLSLRNGPRAAEALFDAAGVAFDREIGSGAPASALIEMAEQHGCDAIIMGARGLGTLRSALLGSVSQGVLQGSRLPVTVVKQAVGLTEADREGQPASRSPG